MANLRRALLRGGIGMLLLVLVVLSGYFGISWRVNSIIRGEHLQRLSTLYGPSRAGSVYSFLKTMVLPEIEQGMTKEEVDGIVMGYDRRVVLTDDGSNVGYVYIDGMGLIDGRYRYEAIFCAFDTDGLLSRVFIENSGLSKVDEYYAYLVF